MVPTLLLIVYTYLDASNQFYQAKLLIILSNMICSPSSIELKPQVAVNFTTFEQSVWNSFQLGDRFGGSEVSVSRIKFLQMEDRWITRPYQFIDNSVLFSMPIQGPRSSYSTARQDNDIKPKDAARGPPINISTACIRNEIYTIIYI